MGVNTSIKVDGLMVGIVGVAVIAAVVWWKWGDKIKDVVTVKLNPTNEGNYANQAYKTVTDPIAQALTGKQGATMVDTCFEPGMGYSPGCLLMKGAHETLNFLGL